MLLRTETLGDAVAAIEHYKKQDQTKQGETPQGETPQGGGGRGTAGGKVLWCDGSVDWRSWGVELGLGLGLSMTLRRAGYAVALQPSATGVVLTAPGTSSGGQIGNGGVPSHTTAAAAGFREAFDDEVMTLLTADYKLNGKVGVLYSMECGSPETLGFTMEAIGFVLALRHILPIKLEVKSSDKCTLACTARRSDHPLRRAAVPHVCFPNAFLIRSDLI
jgi:hypothetical protein